MSSEILKNSLQSAQKLLADTKAIIDACANDNFGSLDLEIAMAENKLADRITVALSEIVAALSAPVEAESKPLKPTLFDVDLDVIARSYEWSIDRNGNLFGLTKGDREFEFTGITLDGESLAAWKRGYIDPIKLLAARGKVQSPDEALVIARENEQELRYELNMWKRSFLKADMTEHGKAIEEFLHSVPLIPQVEPAMEPPREVGPWRYGRDSKSNGDKDFIESDDFTHDVRLYINGDFESEEQRKAYGELVAEKLNAAFQSLPRPRRKLYDELMEGLEVLAKDRTEPAPSTTMTARLQELKDLMFKRLTAGKSKYETIDDHNAMRYVHDALANLLGSRPKIVMAEVTIANVKGGK